MTLRTHALRRCPPSRLRRVTVFLASACLLSACGTKDRAEPRDTAVVGSGRDTSVQAAAPVVAAVSRWDAADGPAIYIPSDGGMAQVILPPVLDDGVPRPNAAALPAGAAPAQVDLFAPLGRVGSVSLGEYSASAQPDVGVGCDAWPVIPMRDPAGIAPQSWRLALQAGVAEAVRADSIGAMSRSDSSQLVIAINRAAALLPLDSLGVLRRVPFGVTKAYRLQFSGDVEAVIAVVERRLNVEASPRVERSVLVLERPPKVKAFSAVWRDTQYAAEDDLIAVDLMAVVRLRGERRPSVFLGLDFGDGSRVQMLQRTDGGIWSLRWASAYTGC